ncbi:MAG TPA: BatD family protein [Lacunisphaera sp.]|jgi:tetratricopeptide (TPR) repeat protein
MRNQHSLFRLTLTYLHHRSRGLSGLPVTGASRNALWRGLLTLLLLPLSAFAQGVHWDPPAGQLGFNQVSQISLVFENCEPDGAPDLPQVSGLTFGRPSQSSQTSIVNFTMTRTFSLVYPVRPDRKASLTIPAFEVKTDKGPQKVAAANYTVGDATVGNSGVALDDIASAKLTLAKDTFWIGEVFPVTFNLNVARRYFHSLASSVEWPATPFVAEEWSKPDPGEALVGGERRVVSVQSTRAYSKKAGSFTLSPASQMVNLIVGSTGFGLFSQPNVEQRQLDSNSVAVTIKPLPAPPADFSGAVGQFTFVSKVVPLSTGIGEPITWNIELSGTGNWPDISGLPQRDVSSDFQVVQPKSKRTMKDGSLFEGTLSEDVVLVPTKAGTYKLPSVHFTYFDTISGSYKTLASEPATVTVTANATPSSSAVNSGAPLQFGNNATKNPVLPAAPTGVPPATPENLPRDPLPDSASGLAPHKASVFWLTFWIPALVLVLVVWLVLAAIRSRENDPQKKRRIARETLKEILAGLGGSSGQSSSLTGKLNAWEKQTAILWEIPHAAPGAPLVESRITSRQKELAPAWTTLWKEADRALHSREQNLPKDWASRAKTALDAVQIPGWPPFSLFATRNLLPFLFTFALILALAPTHAYADTATDNYKKGDFTTAETEWNKAVERSPADWIARHNLGLALAQQDRWAEATAQWTSAFLLNPRSDVTRWDLALGLQRSGMAPTELVDLSRGKNRFKITRLASPGEWQLVLLVASLLLAAALVVLLLQGYRRAGTWAKPTALIACLLAMVLAASATLSLHAYGNLADPEAALVWRATTLFSIPTDVDTKQKNSPLSAGSIAVVEKTFLGWTKLDFPGGQSGWVRTEDLTKLYR